MLAFQLPSAMHVKKEARSLALTCQHAHGFCQQSTNTHNCTYKLFYTLVCTPVERSSSSFAAVCYDASVNTQVLTSKPVSIAAMLLLTNTLCIATLYSSKCYLKLMKLNKGVIQLFLFVLFLFERQAESDASQREIHGKGFKVIYFGVTGFKRCGQTLVSERYSCRLAFEAGQGPWESCRSSLCVSGSMWTVPGPFQSHFFHRLHTEKNQVTTVLQSTPSTQTVLQ